MKNRFSRKVIVSIILIMIFGFVTAGCGSTGGPSTILPPIPTTYTVTIISSHPWCYGTVYVSGTPTSSILIPWGSGTVYNVASGAAIYLVDAAGFQSHTEYFNPLFGNTIVFDYWW